MFWNRILIIWLLMENWLGMPVSMIARQILAILSKNRRHSGALEAWLAFLRVAAWTTHFMYCRRKTQYHKLSRRLKKLVDLVDGTPFARADLIKIAEKIEKCEQFDNLRIWEILIECCETIGDKRETFRFVRLYAKACKWIDKEQVRFELKQIIAKLYCVLDAGRCGTSHGR